MMGIFIFSIMALIVLGRVLHGRELDMVKTPI